MKESDEPICVIIPLSIRKRNGRPKILPSEGVQTWEACSQDPHILKALGRAWAWRRKLDSGEMATVGDIAKSEEVTDRFVSRTMQLAYLSPEILERMLVERKSPTVTLNDLVKAATTQWSQQHDYIFGD